MVATGTAVGPAASDQPVTAAVAAVLVTLVGTAVLAVQTRANASLKAANIRSGRCQRQVDPRPTPTWRTPTNGNGHGSSWRGGAIKMFHTGVERGPAPQAEGVWRACGQSCCAGLAGILSQVGGVARGTDRPRLAAGQLGRAYFEVGELTRQLDSMTDSLAMYRRALAVFEKLAREAPTDAEIQRGIVRSRTAVALQLLSIGQKTEALAVVGPARAIAQAQADAAPADLGCRSELARVDHLMGEILLENSRVEGLNAIEQARAIQEELVRISPSDDEFRSELAQTCDSLASRLDEAGRRDEALVVYDRARDLSEDLFRTNPTDARIAHELVRTLGNLGIALENAGRPIEALAAYDRAREVLEAMGDANPNLLAVDRDRAWINALTARSLIGTARHAEALLLLEGARKARWTLVQADPSVIRDQTQLIDIHLRIARIHAGAKRAAEARASYESAVAVASRLADAHPGDIGIQSLPVGVYRELLDFLSAAGELSAAMSSSEKAMAIQRKLFEADPSQARSLADGVRRQGIVLQKCGRPAEGGLGLPRGDYRP